MTIVLLEERSHLLPPFIILIATLPFTRQTSSPLAWAQESRLEGTLKEICHLFPPLFCCRFHGCRGKTKSSREEEERARVIVFVRARESIVYCLLCNSQRMPLISKADCDTESGWGTGTISLALFFFTLGHTVEWLMAAMWKSCLGEEWNLNCCCQEHYLAFITTCCSGCLRQAALYVRQTRQRHLASLLLIHVRNELVHDNYWQKAGFVYWQSTQRW